MWVYRTQGQQVNKLDSKWIGPAKVIERVGGDSYNILLKPIMTFETHAAYMKPFLPDQPQSTVLEEELYHFLPTHKVLEATPVNGTWRRYYDTARDGTGS